MFHFRARTLLAEYLSGRLRAELRPKLAAHLQRCPICREEATRILGHLKPAQPGARTGQPGNP